MKTVIPWVMNALPRFLLKHNIATITAGGLGAEEPLKIVVGTSSMSSFKEAWNTNNCSEALRKSGVYEAGGNLFWVDPEVAGTAFTLPAEDPAWGWLSAFAKTGFERFQPDGTTERSRIRFPIALETNWRAGVQELGNFPKMLQPIGAQGYIWAWYLAMFNALDSEDVEQVQMLFECALCVTMSATFNRSQSLLALDAIKYSEKVREGTKVLVDSFLTFSEKLLIATADKPEIKFMSQHKICYNGCQTNLTMLRTINSLKPALKCEEVRQLFAEIERTHGTEILTGSYSKVPILCFRGGL